MDIEKHKNSAGQLVASAESERQTPIAEFANSITYFAENINLNAVPKIVDISHGMSRSKRKEVLRLLLDIPHLYRLQLCVRQLTISEPSCYEYMLLARECERPLARECTPP